MHCQGVDDGPSQLRMFHAQVWPLAIQLCTGNDVHLSGHPQKDVDHGVPLDVSPFIRANPHLLPKSPPADSTKMCFLNSLSRGKQRFALLQYTCSLHKSKPQKTNTTCFVGQTFVYFSNKPRMEGWSILFTEIPACKKAATKSSVTCWL